MQTEITHRRVLAVALPIVLSNITVPLLGVVDTFAVGQIGDAASIAAVASAAPPSGMLPITSPVAGLVTANVPPSMASTHCPLMNMTRG